MTLLISSYTTEWRFFKFKLRWGFILISALFTLSTIFFYSEFSRYPEKAVIVSKHVLALDEHEGIYNAEGIIKCLNLLVTNIKVNVITGVSGVIPFLFSPILVILIWGSIFGALFVDAGSRGISISNLFFCGILPHGIFELPAIFYSASIGTLMCFEFSKKIIRKHVAQAQTNSLSFFNIVREAARSYVFVIVPLLVLASLIETYITPFIVKSFLLK